MQDEIVVTVIATGFEDKPTSQGQSVKYWFGSSATSSTSTQSAPKKTHSHIVHLIHVLLMVWRRSHTTKDDDIPSFIRNREERRSRRTRR